jgi:hypothetical protein
MNNLHIFLGATVADAAARPLHWVYDPKKLKKYIKGKKEIAFLKISSSSPYIKFKFVALELDPTKITTK